MVELFTSHVLIIIVQSGAISVVRGVPRYDNILAKLLQQQSLWSSVLSVRRKKTTLLNEPVPYRISSCKYYCLYYCTTVDCCSSPSVHCGEHVAAKGCEVLLCFAGGENKQICPPILPRYRPMPSAAVVGIVVYPSACPRS